MTKTPFIGEGPPARFTTRLKLRNGDTDQFRHVNNAAIATLFEEARMAIFMQDTLADYLEDRHVVVAHLAIDFIAEIFYPGEIDVMTTPIRTGNTSFGLTQALYSDGNLCARASATCVLMDSKQGRPTLLPDPLRQQLVPSCRLQRCIPITARRPDVETFTTLTFELRDGIAIVTLNDVPRRNALSRCMVGELFDAIDLSRARGARALVIAANGPTFCAGANIDDLRDGWMERADPRTDPALLFRRLLEDDRVVVAAVQGPAAGGGFELTLSCDLVIAEEGAWFALPEVTRGVIPNTGLALLPRVVGTRQALQLVLTAQRVSAAEALQRGLVNEVVGKGTSLDRACALARSIVGSAPPGALIAAKRHLHGHAGHDWQRVVRSVTDVPRAEWQEGLDAFTEKRKTDFEPLWQDHQRRMTHQEQLS